jgi:DNA-nicking Smr family endonuclease
MYKRDGKVIDKATGDLYTFEDFMDMHGYGKSQAYCMIKNSKLYEWQINT